MILDYKYLILTCIEEDISIIKGEMSQLLSTITKYPINWNLTQTNLNFKEVYYPAPQSGGAHLINFIIWEPLNRKGTAVFYVNYEDGWNSFIELYAKKFNKVCLQIGLSDEETIYPMTKFSYYEGIRQRSILCYKDDKEWTFFQNGETLPFEKVDYYKKRRIKDRLPNRLIIEYLKETGWNIEDENFWNTNKPVFNFKRTKWD